MLFEASAVVACVPALGAAGLGVVIERAPVIDADEGSDVLIDVFTFLLVAAEEVFAIEQRVSAETKVTSQLLDDAVDVVILCTVQPPSLPQHCPLRMEGGAKQALTSCRRPLPRSGRHSPSIASASP